MGLLGVVAIVAGCSGGGATEEAAVPTAVPVSMTPTEPEPPTADTTRDDDLDHVMALTVNWVAPDEMGDTEPATDEPATDEPAPDEPATDAPATTEPPAPPTTPEPEDTRTDEEILVDILALPDVQTAEIAAPGVIAVATAGPRDELLFVDGVVGIESDELLQIGSEPDQRLQWMISNSGSPDQAGGWPGLVGADTNVTPAWQVSRGQGTVVAVIDSGVDMDHPDLVDRLWTNSREVCGNGVDDDGNGFVDDCRGWDFGDNDNDPNPTPGLDSFTQHGTHVAGIVGAPANGIGVVGMAPDTRLMALKVGRNRTIPTSSLAGAIVYAADNGADVINLSVATPPNTLRSQVTVMESAIAYAGQRGVLVVAGAGNNGLDVSNGPVYPAGFSQFYEHVMSIGATTNSDTRASFSNYGSNITLYAPGWWIWSTYVDGYNFMSGTSMATPVVAGAAAVLLASGQVTTPAAARARLVERADATVTGPRVDVAKAVGLDLPPSVDVRVRGADTLVADVPGRVSLDVAAANLAAPATQVRISLATEVDGQVWAVSGLPMTVTAPDGSTQQLITDGQGSLPPIAVSDPAALATGWTATADLVLPAGDYAIVTELLPAAGAPIEGARVAYLAVPGAPSGDGGGGGAPTTTTPGQQLPPAPSTTAPSGSNGGGTLPGAPTTTAPPSSGGGTVLPTVPTTTPPGGGGGGGGDGGGGGAPPPASPTTTSPRPSGPTTTTATPPAVPATTAPATTAPTPTNPTPTNPTPTTAPSPPTTAPSPTPTTSPSTPTTTAPLPPPDTSGQWRFDSISPRSGSTLGGAKVVIGGRFPTTVPVYVWFGDRVVQAQSTGSTLVVASPAAPAGTVDVSVRFRTSSDHSLTMPGVFTFVAPGGGSGGGSGAPATTTPATPTTAPRGSGGSGGSGGSTVTTTP
ncbi:MAG: S8 family serine peptidase, partial [Actinomycetes bacterium]